MGMRIIRKAEEMQKLAFRWSKAGKRIGLVPTMGALHSGHLSLVEVARSKADRVVMSIYVNPAQFGPKEDFKKYPRPLSADLKKCRAAKVDAVFVPEHLYAADHSTWVDEEAVSRGRCGRARPGHFRGVATVVLKLFNLVRPEVAVFGQKDAQQVEVIRRMVRDLDVPVKILAAPIVRDRDGLAMSSRNVYLSPEERERALALPLLLRLAAGRPRPAEWLARKLRRAGLRVDYAECMGGRLCAAVWVGKTRLIDNIACAGGPG
jgi:pantoate--beta-alanine ligase